eukprot:3901764-Rhodomonas_salina.3
MLSHVKGDFDSDGLALPPSVCVIIPQRQFTYASLVCIEKRIILELYVRLLLAIPSSLGVRLLTSGAWLVYLTSFLVKVVVGTAVEVTRIVPAGMSPYARAMRCPVLAYDIALAVVAIKACRAVCLCACCAMSSTDLGAMSSCDLAFGAIC